MTRISSFVIEGLAGRKRPLRYELDPELNVFFGLNGCGKTSLLKILQSAVTGNSDLLSHVPFESAQVTFYSHFHEVEITRTIDKSGEGDTELEPIFLPGDEEEPSGWMEVQGTPAWESHPSDHQGRPFRSLFLSTSRLFVPSDLGLPSASIRHMRHRPDSGLPTVTVDPEYSLHMQFADQLQERWISASNEMLSEVGRIQRNGLAQILSSFFSADSASPLGEHDMVEAYGRATSFLKRQGVTKRVTKKQFASVYGQDESLMKILSLIGETEVKTEIAEAPRRRLEEAIARFIDPRKTVEFTDRRIEVRDESGQPIQLADISSGEKQLLRMLVELLAAEMSVLLVDEPELSLHIDWQHDLLSAMSGIGQSTQIIVATHSPEIMAEVPDDQIFAL